MARNGSCNVSKSLLDEKRYSHIELMQEIDCSLTLLYDGHWGTTQYLLQCSGLLDVLPPIHKSGKEKQSTSIDRFLLSTDSKDIPPNEGILCDLADVARSTRGAQEKENIACHPVSDASRRSLYDNTICNAKNQPPNQRKTRPTPHECASASILISDPKGDPVI